MQFALYFVIGYAVLYAVVWLHEIGHAVWYRKYRLKRDWWNVQVKPYLFFSTPGAPDETVWNTLQPIQYVLLAYGGITANAVFALVSGALIFAFGSVNVYLQTALWLFMTLHIGEMVSYLFVGSVFLTGDMELVNRYMPGLRVPNLVLGTALSVLYAYVLTIVPQDSKIFVIVFNSITVMAMCLGRVISAKRKTQSR